MLISSLYFQYASLFYVILLIIIYFGKKRVKNRETKIYSYLIFTGLIGVILDIITTYLAYVDVTNIFLNPLCKLYLVYLLIWMYLIGIYIFYIAGNNNILKTSIKIYNVVNIILSIVVMIIPLYNFSENGIIYTYGPGANLLYAMVAVNILIYLLVLFFNFKTINIKKFIPVFAFIILIIFCSMIQKYNPEVLLVTAASIFVTFLMYFTIENPDVKMIDQLNVAKTNAEKANKAKSDFLSSMSHEIRTPLNAIVGFSECILQEDNIEDIHRDAKDVIMASQNLLEIVNGILDISKIEANKMEIVETDYELLPAIENIAKLMIPRIGEKPIELKTNFAVDIPHKMHGDIGKIKQIITNILTNAVKYTERGEINFEVNCVNENDECSLVISVEDTGRGIKPEKIDKLFTKFNRLDEDKNTTIEGTGLGLAITKNLIDMMGGKIVVQSKYNEGSKFTVYLKQKIVDSSSSNEETETTNEIEMKFDNVNVLIVDDNKINLRVADKLLKRYHINTTLIESGMECINKIKNNEKYDLILMDDMMPRMTGTETLNRLKQIPNFNIPVIALTANALSGEREKYIGQGFDEYLAKPMEKIELEKVLLSFLQNKEKQEEKNDIIESTNGMKPKVLIVDDNKINIKVAENFLKPYDFDISSVLSGDECIEKVKNNNYNLIFMDDMMPVLNGVETFHKLQAIQDFNTPVVALTANAINGAREHYLSEGFNEYISKPIDKKELDRVIKLFISDNTNTEENVKEEITTKGNIEYLKKYNIDIDSALSLLGDIEMYNETLNDFRGALNEKIVKLKHFKDDNDMPNYAILVHSLKSDCKYLGFTKLAEISYEHELKSKANDSEYITNNFETLIKEAMRIKVIIDKY